MLSLLLLLLVKQFLALLGVNISCVHDFDAIEHKHDFCKGSIRLHCIKPFGGVWACSWEGRVGDSMFPVYLSLV